MYSLNNDILMSHGGIETNCLTHIFESNDTSNDDAESIHFNILTQSPYVNIDNVASFCDDNNFNVMSFNCRSLMLLVVLVDIPV